MPINQMNNNFYETSLKKRVREIVKSKPLDQQCRALDLVRNIDLALVQNGNFDCSLKLATVDVTKGCDEIYICIERSLKHGPSDQLTTMPPFEIAINPNSVQDLRIVESKRF